ncbi:MAG: M14 family metallocarboxypeptidase [Aliivibrio sp.]|uniref:M14 family metallopeptidase n=1 Tax=Aliivibrio sp. TaxID=1872443 RepID=UPI001A400CAA|nr:M14 family metallocarboxypeptidase [Aliivibrio sp.]
MTLDENAYPIGTPTKAWGQAERALWLDTMTIKRSYLDEVVNKLQQLKSRFELIQYGSLSYNIEKYPLFALKSHHWDENKPTLLVTGGVHGYETSGVHGAIQFLETEAENYSDKFNIIVAPCVSPWGYEVINRWNPNAVDPNRSFYAQSPSEEAASLMAFIDSLNCPITVHIDLHETTDTDNSEFRPALAARDGIEIPYSEIPDGFYLVGDSENPQAAFQKAMIKSVKNITHIALPDSEGNIIGSVLEQEGVINYPMKKLGLCGGFTDCDYSSTTEVYPDSPKVSVQECNDAQVASIIGALNFLIK